MMRKKWAYFLAVLFLLVIRFGVLNSNSDQWLASMHYPQAGHFVSVLRNSGAFQEFMGSWALVFYIAAVLVFWSTEEDDSGIPMQFLLLPIAYVPFSIIGAILMNAEFQFNYLWIHPLVILPFGYLYVSLWTILIWLFDKLRIIK